MDDNKKIHWVIDTESRNILACNKTLEQAETIKSEYPYDHIIILKSI